MNHPRQTPPHLEAELIQLRERVAELEAANAARQQIEVSLSHNRDLLLALSRAAQAVQRARTPDEIYRAVSEQIKALGFEATVFTLDQAAGNLILNYTTFAPAIIRAGEKLAGLSLQDYRMPLSPTSVYGRVLRSGQAEFTQSADDLVAQALPMALRPLAGPLVRLLNIDRGIVAPLRVDEEPLGLLLIAASGVSPDDVPAMDSFAAQVAISLRNVRLAQQAQAELAERKQAEAALRDSEVRYRAIFENAPVGFFQSTPEGRYLSINPAMARMFGYASPDEMLSGITDIASQIYVDLARRQDFMRLIAEQGEVREFVNQNRHKDGHLIHTLNSARAVPDSTGRILYYEGFMTDITARKDAEAALQQSEERYRTLYENSTIGIYRTTSAGDILLANPALVKMLGYASVDELRARNLEQEGYEPVYSRSQFLETIVRNGEVRGLESAWQRRDGTTLYVRESARAIYTAQGDIAYFDGTVEDITERKLAEDALRASESLYQSLVEVSPLSICRKDVAGRFVFANQRFLKESNITLVDLLGKTDYDIHPPELAEKYRSNEQAIMNSGQVRELVEERRLLDGESIVVQSIKTPTYDGAGNINGVQTSFWDITTRQQAEASLHESEQRLRAIIDNAPFGAHLYELRSEQLIFAGFNRAADSILGVDHQQFVGKTIEEAFPPLSQTNIPDAYRRAAATGERYDVDQVDYAEGSIRGAFEVHAFQTGLNRMATFFRDITDRKRAEEAVQESEARLRQMASSLREAIWLRDTRTLEILYVNPAYEELWGRTCESLYQDPRSFLEAVHPDDKDRVMQAIQQQYQGTFFNQEYRIIRPDGSVRWIWGRTFPIRDEAGQLVRITAIAEDITERKQAAERVQRYDFIANTATEFMTLINRQHVFEAVNDAYCRAQGRSRTELIGHALAEVWGETRYREKILPYLEQCFAGQIVRYEDAFVFEGNELRHYQVGMYPYAAAPNGLATYAAIVTVDVTDRVRAEAAQRNLNTLLNQRLTEQTALLKATAAMSSSLEIDTILQQVAQHMGVALNVTSTYLCGWEPATGRSTVLAEWWGADAAAAEQQGSVGESYDLVGDFGDDLDQWLLSGQPFISQVDDPQLYEPARQHMLKCGGQSALTVPLVIKGRSIGYADLWESRRKREFNPGEIALAQGIAQQAAVAMENARLYAQLGRHADELEERVRQRTRQLTEANAKLSELDRLKDDFISRISHELRTPLTSIKIYLELLETGKPEKRARYMQVLTEQSNRLQQLIESLLEVTQNNTNAADLHVAPTDLNRLAASLAADAAPRAIQRGLTFNSVLTSNLPLVSADAIVLAQALSNLVTNALSYTPPGGALDLSTAQVIENGETWVTFSVRDTGPGITPDELLHIFDRFYRGRAAADYKTPGAGVGLSISRDILTALEGRLTVRSDGVAGHGAAFTAWLRPA